jgi:hypothetical protein
VAHGEPIANLGAGGRVRALALAVVLAGGLGCADVVVPATRDAGGLAPASDADIDPTICHVPEDAQGLALAAVAPEVLILLDRSASMDTAFAASTRHEALAALLSDLVATYGAHVRFAYQELPGRQDCAGQPLAECCASPPLVSAQAGNAVVLAALAAAGPAEGATPTAAALQAALAYFAASAGRGDRYVLLATDGAPTCTLAGTLATGLDPADPACADALAEVEALAAAAVRVIVLGIGPELDGATGGGAACLDSLAQAGGAAASPGSPSYYTVENGEQLQRALERTFGAVTRPSCVLEFPAPLKDSGGITVYLDSQRIPRTGSNGWVPDPPPPARPKRVRIVGKYCDQIETFQVSKVVAFYKCPAPDE